MAMSKNKELLIEFTNFCNANPELRFWQALSNWISENNSYSVYIKEDTENEFIDTYYFKGKEK